MAINNALNTATIPLPVAAGGTGVPTIPTNGQIPIGNGTNYVAASITAGSGITITPGSGTLSIATTGSSGALSYLPIAGTTQTAAVNTGYINQNAAATTVTLPVTAPLGSIVAIQGLGAGGWILTAGAGQTIQVGQTATSTGGTVTSAGNFDAIQVICIVANTTWSLYGPVSAGYTIA
jgi:hypothetical protein